MKQVLSCDCPGKGKDVIVITIETCCRKTCRAACAKTKDSDDEDKHSLHGTVSGPVITERIPSEHPPKLRSSKTLKEPSAEKVLEKSKSNVKEPSATLKEPSAEKVLEKSKSDVKEPSAPPSDMTIELEPEGPLVKLSEQQVVEPKRQPSEPKQKRPVAETKKETKNKKEFKLPILVERHHGRGCAMEISVLEKHESSCAYKKEDAEGRSTDDRVGSYDCIGRLVFRTCNSEEVGPDAATTHGGFTGEDKPDTEVILPTRQISSPRRSLQAEEDETLKELHRSIAEAKELSETLIHTKARQSFDAEEKSPPFGSARSSLSDYRSAKSEPSEKFATPEVQSLAEATEEDVVVEKKDPLEAYPRGKPREEQILMVPTTVTKKHYHGDDCKLHAPRNPIFLSNMQFKKISSSKKLFPDYSDEGNQTEPQASKSAETIDSLSLNKTERRRSSFLGSLFSWNAAKSSTSGTKKPKKK